MFGLVFGNLGWGDRLVYGIYILSNDIEEAYNGGFVGTEQNVMA